MKLFLLTTSIIALFFIGISIKIWAKKNGKFSGTCASQNPHLNKDGEPCSFCGRMPDETECRASEVS